MCLPSRLKASVSISLKTTLSISLRAQAGRIAGRRGPVMGSRHTSLRQGSRVSSSLPGTRHSTGIRDTGRTSASRQHRGSSPLSSRDSKASPASLRSSPRLRPSQAQASQPSQAPSPLLPAGICTFTAEQYGTAFPEPVRAAVIYRVPNALGSGQPAGPDAEEVPASS